MKNTLAENLLRFGAKNLSESSKKKLTEATSADFTPFIGEPSPLQNVVYGGARVPSLVLYSKQGPVDLLVDKINYIPADPTKNSPEMVSVQIADRYQNVNYSVVVTNNSISPSRVNKIANLTGFKVGDSWVNAGPMFDAATKGQLLLSKVNYQDLPADHVLKKIQSTLV